MSLKKWRLVLVVALLSPLRVLAGDEKEEQAYCSYVMEQAAAQRDFLRTPTGTAGVTQPETGLPIQIIGGASLGLSDVKKASLTMEAARKNCALYRATTGAQLDIQYALPSLEQEALRNRLVLIERASKSLDALMEKTSLMIDAQNATRLMLFTLQTTKIKLNADLADTQSKLAALYVPALSGEPLKQLVAEKQSDEAGEQKVLDRLARQNNWDVVLSVGVHQQVNPAAQGPQPYGQVSINYNFASRAIDNHLDRSAQAYEDWKKVQQIDVVRGMEALHQQLLDIVTAQESKLKSLQEQSSQLNKNLQLVADADTSASFDFHNQLAAALLLLEVETGDANFRLGQLREYLARNY
jgi:hypothetical protein